VAWGHRSINVKLGQLANAEGTAPGGVDDHTSTCTIAETTALGVSVRVRALSTFPLTGPAGIAHGAPAIATHGQVAG